MRESGFHSVECRTLREAQSEAHKMAARGVTKIEIIENQEWHNGKGHGYRYVVIGE